MERLESGHSANMLVTLGDNDYLESPPLFRANWQKAFGWARRSGLRVGGVLGNHDYELGRGAYELKTLGMPGRYYTRKVGAVQLFFLDSNAITTRQTRWLEQQLSESTAIWKVALFHHPPYTCGGHAGDTDVVRSWVPLFESYGVQLVLSGHDHNYQRFAPRNGVTYVVHWRRRGSALSVAPMSELLSTVGPAILRARFPVRLRDRRALDVSAVTCAAACGPRRPDP
jgi:3',5'-cyclic AMP phosphodiesterase CpdA